MVVLEAEDGRRKDEILLIARETNLPQKKPILTYFWCICWCIFKIVPYDVISFQIFGVFFGASLFFSFSQIIGAFLWLAYRTNVDAS